MDALYPDENARLRTLLQEQQTTIRKMAEYNRLLSQRVAAYASEINRLKALVGGRPIRIEVDGGITPETAPLAIAAGADTLVAGSAVFGKPDYAAAIAALRPSVRA